MPTARIPSPTGPIDLYYEETGRGFPLVWCHEYGGDYRSWEPQVRYFSRRYRVVTWNYRGYPPSEVPKDAAAYSVEIFVEDLRTLMQHLGIARAHVGGLSMGGGVALNFGIRHPDMAESLIIAAAGSGTVGREEFLKNAERQARLYETEGVEAKVRALAENPTRRGFAEKDPRGWAEFLRHVRDHSGLGSALIMRGVQMKRKTIFELEPELRTIRAPALVVVGDQDEPCLEPALFMKRHIPHAGLLTLPMTGHTANIEEPALFNQHVAEFLASVESGRWGTWSRAR
ncbi:MAG TPA: alpha/beta hydrolase [Candidatus Tectomicrobia bacterium]|nr:alpha/beta hydrolase [Candidatus Tectomicrobia bacterium]